MTYGREAVAEATKTAKAIAFDGCHKIYLAMDDEQVRLFQDYGYGSGDGDSTLIMAADAEPEDLLAYLLEWYDMSCGLRFIEAVHTDADDPNRGFVNLIPQGWEEGDEE